MASSPGAAEGDLGNVHLVCHGRSFGNVETSQTTAAVSTNTGFSGSGASSTARRGEVSMAVQFRIEDGEARMNLPASALPEIHGGKNGWLKVTKLEVTADRISGKVKFNFLNSSEFEIDRRTGIMTSEAGFQGDCEKLDLNARAF
jgi:hypothetical protein